MTSTDPVDHPEETYRVALLVLELDPSDENRAMASETYDQIVYAAGEDEANEIHRRVIDGGFFTDGPATTGEGWTPTDYDDRGA